MNLAIDNSNTTNKKSIPLIDLLSGLSLTVPDYCSPVRITGLSCDSRKVKPGDLFFAVPGFSVNGEKYIPEAVSLGASALVVQASDISVESVPVIRCEDIRKTMSQVADRFFNYPSKKLNVIGVTGTNGKTTVTFLINHIMKTFDKDWGKIGTIEYSTAKRTVDAINTTPGSIEIHQLLAEMRDTGMDGCVMEVSSHALDQRRCDDVRFAGAVFTNLTQDHLDYHKDMESYFKVKSTLFNKLLNDDGFAVLNCDDSYYEKLKTLCRGKILTFSTKRNTDKPDASTINIEDCGYKNNCRHFKASYKGKSINGILPLPGKFNLVNIGAALTAVIGLGYDFETAVESLKNAPQVPGRVEKIDWGQLFEIIVDYAHTPDALKNLLLGVETSGEKILVFGCGGDRDKTKRPVMGEIASQYADQLLVTSDNPRTEDPKKIINDIIKGIPENVKHTVIEKRDDAIKTALDRAGKNDLVIIAGKGHEDYQVIGNTRHYFSDPEVVKKNLRKMGYDGS